MLKGVSEIKLKPIDYKSIALPAELQGLLFYSLVFSLKDHINQCIINYDIQQIKMVQMIKVNLI